MAATFTKLSSVFGGEAILDALAREGLTPHRWSNGAGDLYAAHRHDYHKVLYCLRGSIVFRMTATGEAIVLHPGDRLDIEAGTEHGAVVGASGVECFEAARR